MYQFKYGWIESDSTVINDSRINIYIGDSLKSIIVIIPRMESENKREIEKKYNAKLLIFNVFCFFRSRKYDLKDAFAYLV